MIRRTLTLLLALACSSSFAGTWQDFLTMTGELHKMSGELNSSPVNSARENLFEGTLNKWSSMAAELDTKSFNLLVFSLIESYHSSDLKERDWAESLLLRLESAVAPQLKEQLADADWATMLPNTLQNALTLYTIGKVGQLVCMKTNCIEKTWNAVYTERARQLAREKVVISGLLGYRPQPLPKVAGLLEYSEPEWKAALGRLKSWRPRSLSSQMALAGIAGAAIAGATYGYANLGEHKLPPMAMLRLSQVHRACDLSQALAELAKNCESQTESCKDGKAAEATATKIIAESAVLRDSYPALTNLDVSELLKDSQDLLSRIPEKHRPLFALLFNTQSDKREVLCRRLALNTPAQSQLIEKSQLSFEQPSDKADQPKNK